MKTNYSNKTTTLTPAGQVFLTEHDVAHRQTRSVKTIQADRLKAAGIPYCKIGRLVRYRLADVLEYEERHMRRTTSDAGHNQVCRRNMWGQS